MLLQFTTGSVEDRQHYDIRVSILNAGIQPANVLCIFARRSEASGASRIERRVKVMPQQEVSILHETDLKGVHCEVVLKVDSPSLIVTIKGESHYPLHCETFLVDDIEAEEEGEGEGGSAQSMALFWGYASKGPPF